MERRGSSSTSASVNGAEQPDIPVTDTSLFAPPPAPAAPATPPVPSEAAPDPFDPARLRLAMDIFANLGVKKEILTVVVRKPAPDEWVRVQPDPEYRQIGILIERRDERAFYWLDPSLAEVVQHEKMARPRLLVTAINRHGAVFLWPLSLPDAAGRWVPGAETLWGAAEM